MGFPVLLPRAQVSNINDKENWGMTILNLWILVSFTWLIVSLYRRFISKKPLRFEQGVAKVWAMNQEVGRTRLWRLRDTITILMIYFPLLLKYPQFDKVLTLFFIPFILCMQLHSMILLLHHKNHKTTTWLARITLLIMITSAVFFVREIVQVI